MKIQIDTEKKVLRLESDVNLGEFLSKVKILFPDGQWKDYRLETNVEIVWSSPIVYKPYYEYPWQFPYTTFTTTDGVIENQYVDNVYSVEC